MQGVNLRCEAGSLTVVVGAVGAGKSSLLASLCRHISRVEGSVKVREPPLTAAGPVLCCAALKTDRQA